MLGERVEFYWDDAARFKHLRIHDDRERATIASFGVALGRSLIEATPAAVGFDWRSTTALSLRESILRGRAFVDLQALVAVCWAFGIPVIHLGVVPLETKSMHAMVVKHRDRFAILLARNAKYPAVVAFTLAHELGHALLGHIEGASALVDLDNPAEMHDDDPQEQEADVFALNLLTGTPNPLIEPDLANFNAPMLADAAIRAASAYKVEPGTIALTLAYSDGSWARTMTALRFIYGDVPPVSRDINDLARKSLNWGALSDDAAEYLGRIMMERDD